jgi:hypothetical protein
MGGKEAIRMRRQGRTVFRDIVAQSASENAGKIMRKARMANRLAKQLEGRAKMKAYQVKHIALVALASRFPAEVAVSYDPHAPELVIVSWPPAFFSLHAPAAQFEERREEAWAA